MKIKLLYVVALFISISINAQYTETWADFGNSELYMSLNSTSSQDIPLSIFNYDYTSDSPAIPLAPDAKVKRAFKFVKNDVETSSSPNVSFSINGTLKDQALESDNIIVKVKVSFYIVADTDGSTGVDLSSLQRDNGSVLKFSCQLRSSLGATARSSDRPSSDPMNFNTGWNELEFNLTVRPSDATNLNQYDEVKISFGSTTLHPSKDPLKFYTDGTNFIDEQISIYIGSIMSDTALNATALSVDKSELAKIAIYPNPVENILQISSDVSFVKIYTISGQLVKKYNNSNTINISEYAKGVYLLETELANGAKAVNKIIKN